MRRLGLGLCVAALASGCRSPVPTPDADETPPPVSPATTGMIHGEVRTTGGTFEARVCATRLGPGIDFVAEDVDAICTTTDAAGRFELAVSSGVYSVAAAAEQHEPGRKRPVVVSTEPGPGIDFELLPGGRLYAGTIVDIDGQPIPTAKVSHLSGIEVQADAQGRFRMWSAKDGILDVRAPGTMIKVVPTNGDLDVVMLPESSIRGTVVDRDGQPVAGARVSIALDLLKGWGSGYFAVRSDEQGRFHLRQLDPGEFEIRAFAEPDRRFGGELPVSLGFAEQREGVVVVLDTPLVRHFVSVVDAESGAGVPDCEVTLFDDSPFPHVSERTDEAGGMELPLDGLHQLRSVRCPGLAASEPYPQIISYRGLAAARVEVRRGLVYEAILVDPRQQPAAGRIVELRGDSYVEERISDASGRVEFAGLSPGEYDVFETPGSLPRAVVIDERPREAERFEVPDYGRVEIEFPADAIGRDVRLIDCERPDPDAWVRMVYYASIEPSGLAVFDDVGNAGTYHVSFVWDFGDKCDKAVGLPIVVALRETTRVRFDSAPSEPSDGDDILEVRVLDAAGVPVRGAVVSPHGVDDPVGPREWHFEPDKLVLTDAEGRARLTRDDDDELIVIAARPGFHATQKVPPKGDEASEPVTLRLEPIPVAPP